MQTVTTSKKFNLTLSDWVKGLIVAVITPVITIIMTSLQAGNLVFDWKAIGITALAALLAYITKNWLTPAKITITGASNEVVEKVKEGDIDVKVGNTVSQVNPQP